MTPTTTLADAIDAPPLGVVRIDEIVFRARQRKDYGDISTLAESIKSRGLLQPIGIRPDKSIVCGQRRIEAFIQLGLDSIPCHVCKNVDDEIALLQAERDENTCRKDFTPEEAVAIVQELEKLERKEAKERQKEHGGTAPGKAKNTCGKLPQVNEKSRERVAAAVGMSGRTYEKAKAVVATGNRTLIDEMNRTGKVDRAHKKLKAHEKAEADGRAAKVALAAIDSNQGEHNVFHGDSFALASQQLQSNSVALIFTDPPYDRPSLPLFDQLGELANRILVDGGSLVTFCGHCVLPDVLQRLANHLRYFWIGCCLHTGNSTQMREYGINVKWKPLLWFVKGTFRRDRETWLDDLVVSRKEKGLHPWQQSVIEASYFIERLTAKGEIVVDPFCGSGTTALAAKELGREWWTADIDARHVRTARERLV